MLISPRQIWRWWQRRGNRGGTLPSSRQLLSWMDSSPVGWILLDRSNRIRHLNPRA